MAITGQLSSTSRSGEVVQEQVEGKGENLQIEEEQCQTSQCWRRWYNNENRGGGALGTLMKKLIRPETWTGLGLECIGPSKHPQRFSQVYYV